MEGKLVLKYLLDQSGVSLCLSPAYCWTRKGREHQYQVRTWWGKQGRANLIGTLDLAPRGNERLEYQMLEGSCRTGEMLSYLNDLAYARMCYGLQAEPLPTIY